MSESSVEPHSFLLVMVYPGILCSLRTAQQPVVWEDPSLASLKPPQVDIDVSSSALRWATSVGTGHSIRGVLGWKTRVFVILLGVAEPFSLASSVVTCH